MPFPPYKEVSPLTAEQYAEAGKLFHHLDFMVSDFARFMCPGYSYSHITSVDEDEVMFEAAPILGTGDSMPFFVPRSYCLMTYDEAKAAHKVDQTEHAKTKAEAEEIAERAELARLQAKYLQAKYPEE